MISLSDIFVIFLLTARQVDAMTCSRYPINTDMPKSPVDENFIVTISGNPQNYVLGQEYNVTIQAYNGVGFISFKLALENDNGNPSYNKDLGHFELIDPVETRYSPNCINMVESTNTNAKTRIDVSWVAPEEPGIGCVLIRATLLQHRDVWFMDDGGLTRRICEESADEVESAPAGADRNSCCACDEARYELTFEGTWSRNLHPKDFPAKGWITRFSDIVGASHTNDYRFWEYGQIATEGMKEFAEHGSSQTLERQFSYNFKKGKIRTTVKARGPAFPNLNGISLASVRVDPQHHLLSLASKIDPSPDWIVGVSGLELCMSNCTWLDQKIITLYPWDVGTDAGPSYTSPDQPQIPADVIRRMRSDFPNDPRSPFFNNDGAPMKPLAILKIRRQKVYERICEDEESNNFDVPRECFTHPWTAWSECTATCGEGRQFRKRVYKQPEVANIFNCEVEMRQDRNCKGEECGTDERRYDGVRGRDRNDEDDFLEAEEREGSDEAFSRGDCQLTSWGAWSPCSPSCGEGRMTRRRQYVNSKAEVRCQGMKFANLVQYQRCIGRECLEDARSGRKNQVEEDEKETEAEVEQEENGEEAEENEAEGKDEDENEDGHEENDAEEVDEHEDPTKPGLSNWQQNRGRNRYGYGRPNISKEQNREPDDEDVMGKEEDEEDEDENTHKEQQNYGNFPRNRYGYSSRYNVASRRKGTANEVRDGDKVGAEEDNDFGDLSPNRFGYNNRHYGGGRRNNEENDDEEEEEKENDFGRPNESGRSSISSGNRRPYSRLDKPEENEEPDSEPVEMPPYCFRPPTLYPCLKVKEIKNYWFYNYCDDQCMIYTADSCDKNRNKFLSLEECEETCRVPGNEELLERKQRHGCKKSNERRNERRKHSRY